MDQLESRLKELCIQPMNANAYVPVPKNELQELEGEDGVYLEKT